MSTFNRSPKGTQPAVSFPLNPILPSENPAGRVDILLLRVGEELCKRYLGIDVWNGKPELGQSGLKQIAEEFIGLAGIPKTPIDVPMTVAKLMLPRKRKHKLHPRRVA